MELTAAQLDTVRTAVDYLDLDDGAITLDYSGRGMFGRTCVGVVAPGIGGLGFMVRLGVALAQADPDFASEFVEEPIATDSMGLDTIVYWPYVTAPAAEWSIAHNPLNALDLEALRRSKA